jgi:hypothetical protein
MSASKENTSNEMARRQPAERTRPELVETAAPPSLAGREGLLAHAWVDRDVGWLDFNRRVLQQALDARTPLLERLKFLAIFTSNLDEFYMKRVGLLRGKAQVESEEDPVTRAGDARDRLASIRAVVSDLLAEQAECYRGTLLPALREHGIVLASWDDLTAEQKREASLYFDNNVSPALTPLGFDPAHPFPFISNLSTNWGFVLRQPGSDELVPVRVKIPTMLPQWVPLKADVRADERRFISLEELIRHSAGSVFPGMEIVSATLFRILRNAEIDLEEEENETVREAVVDALRQRRFEPVVRSGSMPSSRSSSSPAWASSSCHGRARPTTCRPSPATPPRASRATTGTPRSRPTSAASGSTTRPSSRPRPTTPTCASASTRTATASSTSTRSPSRRAATTQRSVASSRTAAGTRRKTRCRSGADPRQTPRPPRGPTATSAHPARRTPARPPS